MPIITPLDFKEEILKFRDQAPKLPPINQRNGYENFNRTQHDFHGEYLTLPDISTTTKRRIRTRKRAKKNVKKLSGKESSSEVKKVKKRNPPPVRKMPGEITKSFSVVSSAGGSNYLLIQRRSSSASEKMCEGQEDDL